MDKIFARERRKVMEGEKKPRFRIVGATGSIKFFAKHLRKIELQTIAAETGHEVVYLPRDGAGKGKQGEAASTP